MTDSGEEKGWYTYISYMSCISGSICTDGDADVGVLVAADCEPHDAQGGEPADPAS